MMQVAVFSSERFVAATSTTEVYRTLRNLRGDEWLVKIFFVIAVSLREVDSKKKVAMAATLNRLRSCRFLRT